MRNLTLVIVMLGMALIVDIVAMTTLAIQNDRIPDVFVTLAFTIVTGLAALLVRPGRDAPPNP